MRLTLCDAVSSIVAASISIHLNISSADESKVDSKPDTKSSQLPVASSRPCMFSLVIRDDAQWLTILPQRQPPTRSRLSFDSPSGNIDVEWDPYDGRGLLRRVVLRKDVWQVSFWSEPQRDSMNFARNYAWQPAAQSSCPTEPFTDSSIVTYELSELVGIIPSPIAIEIKGNTKSSLGASLNVSDVQAAMMPGNLLRSFDVADLPARVAESAIRVVVQRVERKAVRLVSSRLRAVVCQPLRGSDVKVLPKTCALFDGLDMRALPSISGHFAAALAADLLELSRIAIASDDSAKSPVSELLDIASRSIEAMRRPQLVLEEIQAQFLAIAEAAFASNLSGRRYCGARLALALIAHAQASSQCTASFIHDVLTAPNSYFDTSVCGADFKLTAEEIRRAEEIIADGRSVFELARTMTSLDRMRALLRANLRLIESIVCEPQSSSPCAAAQRLTSIAIAFADRDLPAVITSAESVLLARATHWSEHQRKLMSMFLMFVRESLPISSKDTEEIKLAQARLERSFQVFLDGTAKRDGRDGDVVASLAASLRATAGVDFDGEFKGPLSLPVGIAVDLLARQHSLYQGKTRGVHFELSVLDVGNYLRFSNNGEPEQRYWQDIANLTLGAGFFWGDYDTPFSLTATIGIAPGESLNGDETSSTRKWLGFAAINLGVYVPLIDLN